MPSLAWRLVEWWLKRWLPPMQVVATLGDLQEDLANRDSLGFWRKAIWLMRESRSVASAYRLRQQQDRQRSTRMAKASGTNWAELRLAVRRLVKQPAATIASVVTLAFAIAAATAAWTLISSVLLWPLPVEAPDRLLVLGSRYQTQSGESRPSMSFVYTQFVNLRDSGPFRQMAGGGRWSMMVTEDGIPRPRVIYFATHNFFDTLGVRFAMGRSHRTPTSVARLSPSLSLTATGVTSFSAILAWSAAR